MKEYFVNRINGEPIVLVVDERAGIYLDPEPSQRVVNHSPDGFEWGYDGSGPAQLALAILLDATGDRKLAEALHQSFKWQFLANAPEDGFAITEREVLQWIARARSETAPNT